MTDAGKLETHEDWLAMFYEVDDLMSKMKRSGRGKQILEGNLLDDWGYIKRHCDRARNRHSGMVKVGQWKTIPRLQKTSSLRWA